MTGRGRAGAGGRQELTNNQEQASTTIWITYLDSSTMKGSSKITQHYPQTANWRTCSENWTRIHWAPSQKRRRRRADNDPQEARAKSVFPHTVDPPGRDKVGPSDDGCMRRPPEGRSLAQKGSTDPGPPPPSRRGRKPQAQQRSRVRMRSGTAGYFSRAVHGPLPTPRKEEY